MISMAPVGSAGGAAKYFAADNYYTLEESAEESIWYGEGAELLGLAPGEDHEAEPGAGEGKDQNVPGDAEPEEDAPGEAEAPGGEDGAGEKDHGEKGAGKESKESPGRAAENGALASQRAPKRTGLHLIPSCRAAGPKTALTLLPGLKNRQRCRYQIPLARLTQELSKIFSMASCRTDHRLVNPVNARWGWTSHSRCPNQPHCSRSSAAIHV